MEHYRIDALLGRGGMGEVYRGYDTRLGRPVALKFLSPTAGSTAGVQKFLREARAASALNHPNIITIHDVGETETGHYIVMELVEGQTLRELIRERHSPEFLRPLFDQVVRGLSAAHRTGIVHQDIKPENIMVRQDGYVKLLDFGLARQSLTSDDKTLSTTFEDTGKIAGTLRYMSPEQIRGEAPGTASDIFSLGIVFYEVVTGQHPFEGENAAAVMHGICYQPPIPACRINPEVPFSLEELIGGMLQKDAKARPTAEETLEKLAAANNNTVTVSPPAVKQKTASVGRVRERAELAQALDDVTAGQSLLLCVAGEAGLGKTTLVAEFLQGITAANPPGADAGRGRCSERLEGTGAYLPFLEALENLLQGAGGAGIARAMKLLAPTWYQQVGTFSEESITSPPQKATSSEKLKRELVVFLEEASRLRPIVMFFDDLHWADASTVDLINYLAMRFDRLRLLIVGTYRPEDLRLSKHAFMQVKLDLEARGACRELPLGFLEPSNIQEFLELEFPGNRFPVSFGKTLHSRTEGNPLFLVNVVRYLRDRNVIVQSGGRWTLAQAVPSIERELPQSVRSMIARKIDQLGETNRKLLSVAALQGTAFDTLILSDALQMDAGQVEEYLLEIDEVHGFVRLSGERDLPDGTLTLQYNFVHVLYQHSVLATLTATRRVTLSSRIAKSLLTHYGTESATIAGELALLFEAGREFTQAAEYFLIAAQKAAVLFANGEAAVLAGRGIAMLSRLPSSESRTRQELTLRVTQGVALMSLKGYTDPEVEEAYKKAEVLCEQLGESMSLFPILWGLFTFHHVRAEMDLAMDRSAQLLRLAGDRPTALVQAHNSRGITLLVMGKSEEALEHFRKVMTLYDPHRHASDVLQVGHDPGVLSKSYGARALWYLGYPDQALKSALEGQEIARVRRHPYSIVFATGFVSFVEDLRCDFDSAFKYAEDAMLLAGDDGFPVFSGLCGIVRGWARVRLYHSEDGLAEIHAALEVLKSTGTEVTRSHNMMLLADALYHLKRFDDCSGVVDETLAWSQRTGVHDYDAELCRIGAAAAIGNGTTGSNRDAEELLTRSLEVARSCGGRSWELRTSMDLSELWYSEGRAESARDLLGKIYRDFTEGFQTYDLRRARSLLDRWSHT